MTPPLLTVDRVEGSTAVLVDDEGRTAEVPASWLPDGVGEGDAVTWARADTSGLLAQAQARLDRLRSDAPEGDLDL